MDKRNNQSKREVLTAPELWEHIDYDSDTGVFTWRKRRWRSAKGRAGTLTKKGYVVITINDIQYSAHQLAWLHHYGKWPQKELDHKDTNRSNNAIDNLREATQSQNNGNMSLPPRNKSGYKGVRLTKTGKWESSLNSKGRFFYCGLHTTPEAAARAYLAKAREVFGEFARMR